MDIHTFYQHAIQWKHQQVEAERMAADQYQKEIEAEWKKISEVIRKALPIEGMTIHENFKGQFNEFPRMSLIHPVDCQIDPSHRQMMDYPPENGRSMVGVIRVHVVMYPEDPKPEWKVFQYTVWVNGESKNFEHQYEAFIAAFAQLHA